MTSLPTWQPGQNGVAVSNYLSAVESLIKERESEILNEPIDNELEFMEVEDGEITNLDELAEAPRQSVCEQNGHVSLWGDSKPEDEFERDSSDDNESVISQDEDTEPGETNEKANALKTQGSEFVQQGLWKEAVDCYSKAIQCHQSAMLYGNRALCYMKLGQFIKAERDCCKAIELDPLYKRIFRRRSAIRLRLKDYYGAASDLQTLMVLSHDSPLDQTIIDEYKTILPLARLATWEDKNSKRFQQTEKSVLGQLAEIEESAAKSFSERLQWAQAVDMYSMALIVSPDCARLFYERAVANLNLGKVNLAEADCTDAIRLQPSNHMYYRLRAEVRRKLSKPTESQSDEEKATQLSPVGGVVGHLIEPTSPPAKPPARRQTPPEDTNFVRIPVRNVYTSNREELYDLAKLPDILVCNFP